MKSLSSIRRLAEEHPHEPEAQFFSQLLASLEDGRPIEIARIYELDYGKFQLTLEALREWRLQRFVARAETPH